MKKMRVFALLACAMSVSSVANASPMKYTPVNPSFGGSAFNGSYLLGNAEAQNNNVKPTKTTDPIANFSNTITSSLISRISRDIADSILGENAQDSGTFTVGDTVLNFNREGDVVRINIVNNVNGQQTTVEVPAPTF